MEGSLAQSTLWFSLFLYPHIPALWLFFNYSLMIKDVDSGGRQTWLPSALPLTSCVILVRALSLFIFKTETILLALQGCCKA